MINIVDVEESFCNWTRTDYVAGQDVFETSCGATTTAIVGTINNYKWCPFCKADIKVVERKK